GGRVRLEAVRPASPGGTGLVRVRPGIGKVVPVRRAAAQVPALFAGLGGHRGPDPDPDAGDLSLGRKPQRQHRLIVVFGATVNPAADFRSPQLDAVVLEQRRHRGVLAAAEPRSYSPITIASQPRSGSASAAASAAPAAGAATPASGCTRYRRTPSR